MADTITDNRTLVDSAEANTNYVASSSATADTEIKIQGTASIGEQISNTSRYIMYNAGSVQDWSNNVFYIWINCGIVGLLDTKAAGGFSIRFAGPTVTDFFEFYVGGSDSWPTAIAGGWVQFVVDIEGTASNTGGTPPATTAIQHVGYAAVTASVMTRNTDNTWIDEIRRLPDGTAGIKVQGKNGGTTAWTWPDVVTELGQATGTARTGDAGTIVLNTPVEFFVDDATDHAFDDTNSTVLWADQEWAPTDLYGITVLGAATGTSDWRMGIKTGTGDTATGAQGGAIQASSTGVRWFFTANGANIDTCQLYGVQLIHGGAFLLDSTAIEAISCSFLDCDSALVSNSLQLNNTIVAANTIAGAPFMTTDDLTDIRFCSFEYSAGHAVELTTPRVATQTSKGNLFTNYLGTPGSNLVSASGSTGAAIYNNSTGAVTISVTDSGDTPSIRNGTSATTTVQNSVNLTITVLDEAGTAIQNAQSAIYDSSSVELMNEDTLITGVATQAYAYLSDEAITVRVRKSSPGITRYFTNSSSGTITNAGYTATVTLIEDPIVAP